MTFAREKRLLLGWLAVLVPLPLPFNDVLEWTFLLAYWLALAVFLYRAAEGAESWLPNWAMNLIGLAYLPVIYLDLTRFWGDQILRPLLHLAGFALVVKLFALRREAEKWHLFIGIFFFFLASMGTSVHPSVLLYLIAFLSLATATLIEFAALHFMARFDRPEGRLGSPPIGRLLAGSVVATLVLAVALFPVLPRVGTPYIVAGGVGGGEARVTSSGFSDVMSLDGIGRIRTNEAVAMRLKYPSAPPPRHELRYKGATYDLFEGTGWRRSPRREEPLRPGDFGYFHLADGKPSSWVDVWLEPLGLSNLFIPVEAVALDVRSPYLLLDEGGAVVAQMHSLDGISYRVALGEGPSSAARPPDESSNALDPSGISPRIEALAAEVMGDTGSLLERLRRLERHMTDSYDYTLDLLGRNADHPIEAFLFEDRRGHCELFASATVLMLRSQAVPARLVTGFLGAERSPLEDYFIVRNSNAHAWVEAYLPEHGWLVVEPTPPAGRPTAGAGTLWLKALQAYDYLIFRWDRYVLTFGAADQIGLLAGLRDLFDGLKVALFGDRDDGKAIRPAETGEVLGLDEPSEGRRGPARLASAWWIVLALTALLVAFWSWRRRPRFDATRAYRTLRQRARRRGLELPESLPPQAVVERMKKTWPESSRSVERILERYLEESFGGRRLTGEEIDEIKRQLRNAGQSMKKAA